MNEFSPVRVPTEHFQHLHHPFLGHSARITATAHSLSLTLSLSLSLALSLSLCVSLNALLILVSEAFYWKHTTQLLFSTSAPTISTAVALRHRHCPLSLSHSLSLSLSHGSSLLQTYYATTVLHVCPQILHCQGPHLSSVWFTAELLPVSPRAYSTFSQCPMNWKTPAKYARPAPPKAAPSARQPWRLRQWTTSESSSTLL